MPITFSTEEIAKNLLPHCADVLRATLNDPVRTSELEQLGILSNTLETFVRGYERITDPKIDTDDEILNWVFSEAIADLWSATWLLASGFYKGSASSLRNAFDIGTAALYFQIRQNNQSTSDGYNHFFSQWDRGDRQTPNWGEMKGYISMQPTVKKFNKNNNVDIVELAYAHFKYLCAYTHSSSFADNGDPITAINTTGIQPSFDTKYFQRGRDLTIKTISLIAILWQVVFPKIIATAPFGPISNPLYSSLFNEPIGVAATTHT